MSDNNTHSPFYFFGGKNGIWTIGRRRNYIWIKPILKKWEDCRIFLIINEILHEFEISHHITSIKLAPDKSGYLVSFIDNKCIYININKSCKPARAFKLDWSAYDIIGIGSYNDKIIKAQNSLEIDVKIHCKRKHYDSKKRYQLNKS